MKKNGVVNFFAFILTSPLSNSTPRFFQKSLRLIDIFHGTGVHVASRALLQEGKTKHVS